MSIVKILYRKWLMHYVLTFLFASVISCDCGNPNQPRSNNSNQRTPHSPNIPNPPNTPRNNGDNPPPPNPEKDQAKSIAEAIQKLEKELRKPDANPKLQAIYEILKWLPDVTFFTDLDGTKTIKVAQKNGIELFEGIIQQARRGREGTPEAVVWLIDQQLLDPNEVDEQGYTLLEKIFATCTTGYMDDEISAGLAAISQNLKDKGAKLSLEKSSELLEKFIEKHYIQSNPKKRNKKVINFLKTQGISLTTSQASDLLEKLIEKQLTNTETPEELLEMVKFLESQGGTISSQKGMDLLVKFLRRGLPPQSIAATDEDKSNQLLYNYILDLLQKEPPVAMDTGKATDLLQQALNKEQEKGGKLYTILLKLGADPNKVKIKDSYHNDMNPFLHFVIQNSYKKDFKTLFEDLVNNPQTDINIVTDNRKFTAAMEVVYSPTSSTTKVGCLLKRPDLDINSIKGNYTGVEGYTLLDMVVGNCMVLPTGHDSQKKEKAENNKRWLELLKKMTMHPNFYVTEDNIRKAEGCLLQLRNSFPDKYVRESRKIGEEILELIENSSKRR